MLADRRLASGINHQGNESRMTTYQLTHVALVGARMDAFRSLGFRDRNELALQVVVPPDVAGLADLSPEERIIALKAQLPLWVHNIISDPSFPRRDKLLMPLRRFEGELQDNKGDDVVAAVLSAGFRSRPLDPLNLPPVMPMRQRCAIVVQIGPWQEAFRALERDLIATLADYLDEVVRWCGLYRREEARCLLAE
jgi:hypothetical protein